MSSRKVRYYRRRTSHATPARRHHIGLSPVDTTVSPAHLASCPALAPGRDACPGARTVTAALRPMGLSGERHSTNEHCVLNWTLWSAHQASRILLRRLITSPVPPDAAIVLGTNDTLERRLVPNHELAHGQARTGNAQTPAADIRRLHSTRDAFWGMHSCGRYGTIAPALPLHVSALAKLFG